MELHQREARRPRRSPHLVDPLLPITAQDVIADNSDSYNDDDIDEAKIPQQQLELASPDPDDEKPKYERRRRRGRLQLRLDRLSARMPARCKLICFATWIAWKIVTTSVVLYFLSSQLRNPDGSIDPGKLIRAVLHINQPSETAGDVVRVLYIVTSSEQNRLSPYMLPLLKENVASMVNMTNYEVDVYLVLGYSLEVESWRRIRNELPSTVGLEVWDDAVPVGYSDDNRRNTDHLTNRTSILSRQHRYVVKDKFHYYDLFCAFKDDIRIKGHHVRHFVELSNQLEMLRRNSGNQETAFYFGPMGRKQVDRLIPGFLLVERVPLNRTVRRESFLSRDYRFGTSAKELHFDAQYCCSDEGSTSGSVVSVWDASAEAMGLRKLPQIDAPGAYSNSSTVSSLEWIGLLPESNEHELGYHYYSSGKNRPKPGTSIPHQEGWMATPRQILRLQQSCVGGFLPPFPVSAEIQGRDSVEDFLAGRFRGCRLQRFISLDPRHYSKHFLYHISTKAASPNAPGHAVPVDHLFGELNTLSKQAEKAMTKVVAAAIRI